MSMMLFSQEERGDNGRVRAGRDEGGKEWGLESRWKAEQGEEG